MYMMERHRKCTVDPQYNTYFDYRTAQWIGSPLPDEKVVIETIVLPGSTGIDVGIVSHNDLQMVTLPDFEWNRSADSEGLFHCVTVVLQHFNVILHIDGHPFSAAFLFKNINDKSVKSEIIQVKQNVKKCKSYTMVQLFHQQVVEPTGIEPVNVTFVFYILLPYSGGDDDLLVQINSKYNDDCIPMTGYEPVNVPLLTKEENRAIWTCFAEAKFSHRMSLCGLHPFVIWPCMMKSVGGSDENDDNTVHECVLYLPTDQLEVADNEDGSNYDPTDNMSDNEGTLEDELRCEETLDWVEPEDVESLLDTNTAWSSGAEEMDPILQAILFGDEWPSVNLEE